MKKTDTKPNILEITNFSGALTRVRNGDINSGMAKFVTSFGYDPFSKPRQLTWLESPVDITGTAISDLIVGTLLRTEASLLYTYAIGSTGNLYKIQSNSSTNANVDSVVGISSVKASGATYNFGGSLQLFNYVLSSVTGKLYVGGDVQVNSINTDGSNDTIVGTAANYTTNRFRPLAQFQGNLVFGNGNNIGLIGSTGTVTSPIIGASSLYGQLNPALPPETYITDLDVSLDGNYLLITTSGANTEQLNNFTVNRLAGANSSPGNIYYWNGSDTGATTSKNLGQFTPSAVQTYFDKNYIFINDAFGTSINDGTKKVISLPNNKLPFANATAVNGNFITWVSPELNAAGTGLSASMYYFGRLDEENPEGLWRVLRYNTTLTSGFIVNTPVNVVTNNKFTAINDGGTAVVTLGYGKHYFSVFDRNSTTSKFTLQRFLITPTGTGTPQLGVYETQNQLFSKKITVKQIRVYTEPTVANNGFQLDIIQNDGTVVTNGAFTYTFSAGTDVTLLQGALERINFNPACKDLFSLGLRITNTGTVNMTINKIEVDYEESGK